MTLSARYHVHTFDIGFQLPQTNVIAYPIPIARTYAHHTNSVCVCVHVSLAVSLCLSFCVSLCFSPCASASHLPSTSFSPLSLHLQSLWIPPQALYVLQHPLTAASSSNPAALTFLPHQTQLLVKGAISFMIQPLMRGRGTGWWMALK